MPGEGQEGETAVSKKEAISTPETVLCQEYAEAKTVNKAVAYSFIEEKGGRLKPVQGETVYVLVTKELPVSVVADYGKKEKTFIIKIEPHVGTKKIQEREIDQFTGKPGATYEQDVPDEYVTLSAAEVTKDDLIPVKMVKKYPDLQVPLLSPEQGGIGIMVFGKDSSVGGGARREPGIFRLTDDQLFVSMLSLDTGEQGPYRELSRSMVKEIRVKKKE